MITGAAKVAGVVGWPVKHSLSPLIHNAWIEALGLDAVYVPFAVPPERFSAFVEGHRGGAIVGLNVTIPHKPSAYRSADERDGDAQFALAANVLLFQDGRVVADNTDGHGMLWGLGAACPSFRIKAGPAVVLGAGGAASAAVIALETSGAPEVRVVARRLEAALDMVRLDPPFRAYALDNLDRALTGAQLVINATSAGLNNVGELPPMDAAPPDAVFMDMVYSPLRTKFLSLAAARGNPTVDGLAMLIGQARLSFLFFFGVEAPPPEVVDVRALCLRELGEME